MSEDRRRPGQLASLRDDALSRWMRDVVHVHSATGRAALDAAGLGRDGVRTVADLTRLPITPLPALGDGRDRVLQPDVDAVTAAMSPVERARALAGRLLGEGADAVRVRLDDAYKPVLWTVLPVARPAGSATDAGAPPRLFTAWSRRDLDTLAVLGRRALSIAGTKAEDRILVLDGATGIGSAQLAEGARDAGVAVLGLAGPVDAEVVAVAGPSIVAGPPAALADLVAAGLPGSVRILIAHAASEDERRAAREVAASTTVDTSIWWAPAGTRAAWPSCPGGNGHHIFPTHEVLEILGPDGAPAPAGALVWTPIGWRGSVWLRVDLGVTASVDDDTCHRCGRTTPRVRPERVNPPYVDALRLRADVADWLVIRQADGTGLVAFRPARGTDAEEVRRAVAETTGFEAVAMRRSHLDALLARAAGAHTVDEATVEGALAELTTDDADERAGTTAADDSPAAGRTGDEPAGDTAPTRGRIQRRPRPGRPIR